MLIRSHERDVYASVLAGNHDMSTCAALEGTYVSTSILERLSTSGPSSDSGQDTTSAFVRYERDTNPSSAPVKLKAGKGRSSRVTADRCQTHPSRGRTGAVRPPPRTAIACVISSQDLERRESQNQRRGLIRKGPHLLSQISHARRLPMRRSRGNKSQRILRSATATWTMQAYR